MLCSVPVAPGVWGELGLGLCCPRLLSRMHGFPLHSVPRALAPMPRPTPALPPQGECHQASPWLWCWACGRSGLPALEWWQHAGDQLGDMPRFPHEGWKACGAGAHPDDNLGMHLLQLLVTGKLRHSVPVGPAQVQQQPPVGHCPQPFLRPGSHSPPCPCHLLLAPGQLLMLQGRWLLSGHTAG